MNDARRNDDDLIRLLSRRRTLALLGGAGFSGFLAACGSATSATTLTSADTATTMTTSATPSPSATAATGTAAACVLMPEQEEGPYYVQGPHIRSAITNGKAGLAMTLAVTVVDVTTCQPIPAAAVDVWHADAAGTYSTAADGMFLRGVQLTDEAGIATFTTIYPGWYPGRTNHVHLKVHVGGSLQSDVYQGGHVSHTGNLFFPDDVSAAVARVAPYVSNPVSRTPRDGDFVYKAQNGNRAIIVLDPQSTSVPTGGYQASIVVGINPSATPALIGIHN